MGSRLLQSQSAVSLPAPDSDKLGARAGARAPKFKHAQILQLKEVV